MKSLLKRTVAAALSLSVALGIPVTTAGAYSVSDEGEYYISFDSRYGFMEDAEIGGTAASRKSVKFNFDSEDEVIDLDELTGEITNTYYTLEGWEFAFDDSGEVHTTVSKDDYTNGKYLYATAVFDTENLPKDSGVYYLDLDLKSGAGSEIDSYKYDGCSYAALEFDALDFDYYDLPTPTKEGAEFNGWMLYNSDYDSYKKVTSLSADDFENNDSDVIKLVASYEKKAEGSDKAFFNLDANGGTIDREKTQAYTGVFHGNFAQSETIILDAYEPDEREGYSFTGWNTKADGSGEDVHTLSYTDIAWNSSGDVKTYYAQWDKKQEDTYKIYFKSWYGTIDGKSENGLAQKDVEFTFTDSDNFTDYLYLTAKFKVIGYEEDENGEPTPIYKDKDGNPVCRRQWWLTLDANGGTIDGKDVEKYTIFSYWSDVTNPLNIPEFTPVRDGYVFKGWNTKQDGSGDYVTNGRIGPFYAQWEEDTAPKHDEIYGDLDNGKKVTSADSLLILRASVKLENFDDFKTKLADIDGDGKISSADVLEVLRYSVKLPTKGNIGEQYKEN